MLAKGIYNFSCAGHGGVIAVLGVADLPEHAIEAARKTGKIEVVMVQGRRTYTSEKYKAESLREHARANPSATLYEVWVGEEDCDWATILYASEKAREGAKKKGWTVTDETILICLKNWNTDYLEAMGA